MMSSDTPTMPSLRSSTIVVPYTFTSLRVQKNSLPWKLFTRILMNLAKCGLGMSNSCVPASSSAVNSPSCVHLGVG